MPHVACQTCSRSFYVKPNRIIRGWGKFCSRACQHRGQRTGIYALCYICGKKAYKTTTDQQRSKSKLFFCGKSCQTKWRNSELYIGKNHKNWVSGKSSYRQRLLRSDTEQLCAKCLTTDTRILAGHHKDKNRFNNDRQNLLWLCHNCHYLVHHYKSEAKGFLIQA